MATTCHNFDTRFKKDSISQINLTARFPKLLKRTERSQNHFHCDRVRLYLSSLEDSLGETQKDQRYRPCRPANPVSHEFYIV